MNSEIIVAAAAALNNAFSVSFFMALGLFVGGFTKKRPPPCQPKAFAPYRCNTPLRPYLSPIIIFQMLNFNSLPKLAQIALSRAVKDFLSLAPKDLYIPVAPADSWLSALKKLNVRLGGDGMPLADEIWRAVEYLESQLDAPGVCESCGAN